MIWLLACLAHRTGLVVEDPLRIQAPDGLETPIRTPGDAAPVRYLHGCVVEVHGPLIFNTLTVRDWRVLDAGDGSGNFVGPLRAYGARIFIDDRNSQTPLLLDDASAGPLRPYIGQTVLIIGHVTGAGYVVPVAFRVLGP